MKKTTLTTAILSALLSFTTPLYAADPAQSCPSAAAIIQGGLNASITEAIDEQQAYGVGQTGTYGTPYTWAFAMFIPFSVASNEQAAFNLAKAALPSLTSQNNIPIYDNGASFCIYNANGYEIAAMTPIQMDRMAKRLFAK